MSRSLFNNGRLKNPAINKSNLSKTRQVQKETLQRAAPRAGATPSHFQLKNLSFAVDSDSENLPKFYAQKEFSFAEIKTSQVGAHW